MFIGHFAAGFAGKKIAPRGSLTAYVLAAQLADVLWPVFILTGVERVTIAPGDTAFTPLRFDSYPISHSLVMDLVWGALVGALVLWRTRSRSSAVTAALLVPSHWLLDFATHRPDMPLLPAGGPRLGLGLWNSVPGTLVVESLLFVGAAWLYARATRPRGRSGTVSLSVLVAFLVAAYVGAAFGPPPPSVTAIGVAGLLGAAILLGLAHWADRTRVEV